MQCDNFESLVEVATDEQDFDVEAHREEKEQAKRTVAKSARLKTYPMSMIKAPGREEDDPNILFRHNWLAKGQSVTVTSSTGVGKSSLVVQCALNWARGKTFLAEPMRPLKICIIQAEDSERDLQEQADGMRRGLVEVDGWTPEEVRSAEECVFFSDDFIGLVGDDFIDRLREFQAVKRFDLIVINPVQAFFGGDVSDQEAVSRFCRAGLDPIMKGEETSCCMMIVMHTSKQQSGKKEGQNNVDDYGEYMMTGSHEWADWSRAIFAFLKEGKSDFVFALKAAKRGRRLQWRDEDGKIVTKKMMKHSEGFIYWQEATDDDDPALLEAKAKQDEKMHRLAEHLREHPSYQTEAREWNERLTKDCWQGLRSRLESFGLVERKVNVDGIYRIYIGTREGLNKLEDELYKNGGDR